jgi:hypothetical protein
MFESAGECIAQGDYILLPFTYPQGKKQFIARFARNKLPKNLFPFPAASATPQGVF